MLVLAHHRIDFPDFAQHAATIQRPLPRSNAAKMARANGSKNRPLGGFVPVCAGVEIRPSQLFDAVAIIVSEKGCAALMQESAAVEFVMNAFGAFEKPSARTKLRGPCSIRRGSIPMTVSWASTTGS